MFLEIEPRVKVYLPPGTRSDHFLPSSSQSLVAGSQDARAKIDEALEIAQVHMGSRTRAVEYVEVGPEDDRPELEPEVADAAGDDWDMINDDLANEHPRDILDLKALDLKVSLRDTIRTVQRGPDTLSVEQRRVVNAAMSGKNIFFTGSAGTGKSVVLREIIRLLRQDEWMLNETAVAVTASTGIAAVNIGGTTVHSWAGIGKGEQEVESLLLQILGPYRYDELKEWEEKGNYYPPVQWERVTKRMGRWRHCRVLVIDEISMIDARLFDKLEYLARRIRNNPKPFGGIQLVICGDFFQLPPVPGRDEYDTKIPSLFAFEALNWDSCIQETFILKEVYRQKDPVFSKMLNALRVGQVDLETANILRSLDRPVAYPDDVEPAELYPRRFEVDIVNSLRLNRIEGHLWIYKAYDFAGYEVNGTKVTPKKMRYLLDNVMAPEVLVLKVGAQVMLVRNLVQGVLVNGSRGTVIDFMTARDAVKARIHLSYISKIPWPTDDMDQESYEALEAKKREEYDEILRNPRPWPIVDFVSFQNPLKAIRVCCYSTEFEVHTAYGGRRAVREQVPLIMSWAITMHKSQGQTLHRVKIDLKSVFEHGQAYVALSRATSMDTLQVHGFDPAKVTADYRVLHWTRMVTLEEQEVGEEEEDLPPDLPAHYFPDEDEDMDPLIYDEDWDMTASFIPV